MIRDALLPVLRERFRDRGLRESGPPGPLAAFPAAHPPVGDLLIQADGGKATIYVGDVTLPGKLIKFEVVVD